MLTSRYTLRHPEFHAAVTEHRQHGKDALPLTGLAVQLGQLRRYLGAVAAEVRRHEEQHRKLNRAPSKRSGHRFPRPRRRGLGSG